MRRTRRRRRGGGTRRSSRPPALPQPRTPWLLPPLRLTTPSRQRRTATPAAARPRCARPRRRMRRPWRWRWSWRDPWRHRRPWETAAAEVAARGRRRWCRRRCPADAGRAPPRSPRCTPLHFLNKYYYYYSVVLVFRGFLLIGIF